MVQNEKRIVLDQGYYSTSPNQDINNQIPSKDDIIREIQEPLRFLCVFTATTTKINGARIETSDIKVPIELEGKNFKITDIWISAISSTAQDFTPGDNLLVGLMLNGKSILQGASQSINGATMNLDMLPVPLIAYIEAAKTASRKAHYKLLSELFSNIKTVRLIFSHQSTQVVFYLVYLTIGGVIL